MQINFWNLPEKRNYIKLKKKLSEKLVNKLPPEKYKWRIRNNIKKGKISIEKIKIIAKKENISLKKIEKNIMWIGGNNSRGLSNPKFPINFSSRNGARFIAAIINDGTLTKNGENNRAYGRLMYDNYDSSLRESIIKDYLKIFGGKKEEVAFRNSEKKKYLEFSSIIRDITEIIIKEKGPKTESNIKIPRFIFNSKENMLGWIEQTIADEGEIKNYPSKRFADKYRRAIVWRRSLDLTDQVNLKIKKRISINRLPKRIKEIIKNKKFYLIEGERNILNKLGIDFTIYHLEIYSTEKEKIRTRYEIRLTKRVNLIKLRRLIKIPSKGKNKKFNEMIKKFVRYKEPLKIKNIIIQIGKIKNNFTSLDIKKRMKYKQANTAIKWIKIFEERGVIKQIKKSSYGGGKYRQPAEYKLL